MPLQVTSFNTGTGSTGSTVSVPLSFEPGLLIFFWSGRTETGDVHGRLDHKRGAGVAIDASRYHTAHTQSQDAVPVSSADQGVRSDACITILTTGGAVDGRMSLQSKDASGFVLAVDDAFSVSFRIHCLAFSKSMIRQADRAMFTVPSSTGPQTVTPWSFDPHHLIFMGNPSSLDPPSTAPDSRMFVGFATKEQGEQIVWAGGSNDGSDPTLTGSYCRRGKSIAFVASDLSSINGRGRVTGWPAGGFEVTHDEVFGSAVRDVLVVGFKGPPCRIEGLHSKLDTVTDMVVSGLPFSPTGGLVLSSNHVENGIDDFNGLDSWSLGAFDKQLNQRAVVMRDQSGAPDTIVSTGQEHDACYADHAGGIYPTDIMSVKSIQPDGLTARMDLAESAASSFMGLVLFGETGGAVPLVNGGLINNGLAGRRLVS